MQTWLQAMDLKIQQLGGFGVYRFLENLFHVFEALFEVLTYSDSTAAKNALGMLQRIRQISKVRIVISLRNKTMYINILQLKRHFQLPTKLNSNLMTQ